MIDTTTALEARANLEWIAGKWGELQGRLRKSGGDPNAPRVGGSKEPPSEIDWTVSDLLHEITTHAVFLGHVLIDETDWRQEHGEMPMLLVDVAGQYGHFVCDPDEKVAYDFCDTASELRRKVEGVLNRGLDDPKRYIGPCFKDKCQAELYMPVGDIAGVCPECGTEWTVASQFRSANADAQDVLIERAELVRVLKTIYGERGNLVYEWTSGDAPRLMPKEQGLYRLGDAIALAENKGKRRARPRSYA